MKIAICDDLREERAGLAVLLREYFAGRKENADIEEFESGEAFLRSFTPGAYNLVFLDIYMTGITGVETARQLKAADPDCVIVFTTTSREHGAEAFDLEGFHYLVKPIDREKLFAVLAKWYNMLCEVKTVTLKCGRATREVFVRDVLYVEVMGRNSSVHTLTESIETQTPLSGVASLLPSDEFCRPIRYLLVSLRHIKSISEDCVVLDNDEKLALSRRERENVKERLASFRLAQLRRR